MSNIKYSIEQTDGAIVARSTVKSFNLDHVTDKDITSYYRSISSQALFDTGLMPLNGTGVLAIRSAGRHTQIAFQHQPNLAYINWGANEGDRNAKAYVLAQPYRIWIADLLDGNLYGARMFYSPYAISHPDQPLYHVNLPNTNCKGYRGNGVGWQCLYHNEDWTNLSFNEKIDKLIQRCSGIEAYNDANMSETDGPRFYSENGKPDYLWNPTLWQEKSEAEGIDWTLDENLWIPILVKDLDNQDKHYSDGQPLTFAMALLGQYNSYYNDNYHPKLVNSFARPDIKIPVNQVFDIFAQAHNSASSEPQKFDQLNAASASKVKIAETLLPKSIIADNNDDDEQDNSLSTCNSCEDKFNEDDSGFTDKTGGKWCQGCFDEYFTYCENTEEYLHNEDEDLVYIEQEGCYIDASYAETQDCPTCDALHWKQKGSTGNYSIYEYNYVDEDGNEKNVDFCSSCFDSFVEKHIPTVIPQQTHPWSSKYYAYRDNCHHCQVVLFKDIPELSHLSIKVKRIKAKEFDFTDNEIPYDGWEVHEESVCLSCAKNYSYCSGGHWNTQSKTSIVPWVSAPFDNKIDGTEIILKANEICSYCLNKDYDDSDPLSIPFRTRKLLTQAISAIQYQINPVFSPSFELFNTDGTPYNHLPF